MPCTWPSCTQSLKKKKRKKTVFVFNNAAKLRKLSAGTLYVLATRFVPGLIIIAQSETNARSRMVTVEYVKYVTLMKSPKLHVARSCINSTALSRTAHDTYFLVFDYRRLSAFPSEIWRRIYSRNCERKHFASTRRPPSPTATEIRVAPKGSIFSWGKLHNEEQCFDMVNSSVENM